MQTAIAQRGGFSKIRCLAARKEPDIEIEVALSNGAPTPEWQYSLAISQQVRGHRQPTVQSERVWKHGDLILNRPDTNDRQDEERRSQTHLEQINSNSAFREIARFFESVRYLHLVPQLLRNPEAFQGPGVPDDPFGRNFLEMIVKTPETERRRRLKRIEKVLRQAVPQLKDLTETRDESGMPHLEATYEHWRPRAGKQREDQLSDGTLRLIGLFWSLLDSGSPLLLEEPELSLHSDITSKLPALFYRVQKKQRRQIFVSTHSPDLLSDRGIGVEEVLVLQPGKEGTAVRHASSLSDVTRLLKAGLSPADVVLGYTRPKDLQQLDLFS